MRAMSSAGLRRLWLGQQSRPRLRNQNADFPCLAVAASRSSQPRVANAAAAAAASGGGGGPDLLRFLTCLSYVKVLTTFVKYWPQIRLNAARRSTVGFNISNSITDLSGGLLSLSQQGLDAWLFADATLVTVRRGVGGRRRRKGKRRKKEEKTHPLRPRPFFFSSL